VFQFQLGPEFKASAARLAQPLAPFVQNISHRVSAGARHILIGGVAGWAAVVIAGAVLMAHAAPDRVASPAPVSAAADVAVAPPAAKVEPTQVAVQPEKPAAPPVAEKSTQRVDMTPTASIPPEPLHKPRHKLHKKKVDNSN